MIQILSIKYKLILLVCLAVIALMGPYLTPPPLIVQSQRQPSYNHPRLFFEDADLTRLREQANTTHRTIWEPILAYASSQLDTPPPANTPPGTKEAEFTTYGSRLVPFAFACVITEAPQYCDLTRHYLLAYAAWDQWDEDGQRGMGLAFMVYGNSLAYDWVYATLSPTEQQRVGASLSQWAERLYQASRTVDNYNGTWRNWWGKSYLQNHYWITHSALGLAGLALLGDSVESVCTITARNNVNLRAGPSTDESVLEVLPAGQDMTVLDSTTDAQGYIWFLLPNARWVRSDVVIVPPECTVGKITPQDLVNYARSKLSTGRDVLESIQDGSWHESIYYQTSMLSVAIPFFYNLRKLQGTDLFPHLYLQHYLDWRLYNYIPETTQFIFAHGDFEWSYHNGFRPQNILRFLAKEYHSGYAEWLAEQAVIADGRIVEVYSAPWYVLEFLYYDPAIMPAEPDRNLPTGHVFPDFEGVILRTGWEPDDLIFGLKTGAYGGRYAFSSFVNGYYPWEPPCNIVGCSLNVGHDHDDTNGFYLHGNGHWLAPETAGVEKNDTSYHNTLLIDGLGQYRPPDNHFGVYADDFIDRDGFLEQYASSPITDYVAADATRRYTQPDISDITRHVFFVRPDYFVMIDSLVAAEPHRYTWISHFGSEVSVQDEWIIGQANEHTGLGVLPVWPPEHAITIGHDGQPFVHIEPDQATSSTLLVNILMPFSTPDMPGTLAASVVEDTGASLLLRIQHANGEQEDILLRYAPAKPETTVVGPYQFGGEAAVIRFDATQQPQSVFLLGEGPLQHMDFGDLLMSPSVEVESVTLNLPR